MNDTIEIYLEFSEEVGKLLTQNNISINDVLRRANIDADISYAESPFVTEDGFATRNVVYKIAVSAVALALLAPAFVDAVNKLKNDPEIVRETWYELKPVTDPKTGKHLHDKKGNHTFYKVPHLELSQAKQKDTKTEIKLEIPKVLSISFSTEDKDTK